MPGTILFKPVQANLLKDNDFFTKMDTYCTITIGNHEVKGAVCKNGGKQPHWNDTLMIRRSYEPTCTLKIIAKEWLRNDAVVGIVNIDLREIESKGHVSRWYNVLCNNEPAGELLMESMFAADNSTSYKQTPYQQSYTKAPSPYKDYGRSAYPQDIYSPAKQDPFDQRRIAQIPLSQIPGLEYVHQITFPHISHHLTADEYNKLHSRQEERYQPTRQVVNKQSAPPSWPGYELYAVERSPDKQEHSIGSTLGESPENQRGTVEGTQPESPKITSYYPLLGGVSYAPSRQGISYRPYHEKRVSSPVETKQKSILEKFDAVANESRSNVLDNVQSFETNAI